MSGVWNYPGLDDHIWQRNADWPHFTPGIGNYGAPLTTFCNKRETD